MATYRRFRVQRKYINGQPTDETRLGEYIDSTDYSSLEECERGSGCTDLEYRWADIQNEYICEGVNKYQKQRREQRCVGTEEWTAIYPYQYQMGSLIEKDSSDCGYEANYYKVYPITDGGGNIIVTPSLPSYRQNTEINITQEENIFYTLSYYEYGSTAAYGSSTTSKTFTLLMTNDWYISGHYVYSEPEPAVEGELYYSYTDGTESTLIHSASTLTKSLYNGSKAVIIRDLSGIITSIPQSAFTSTSLTEIYLPVCKYISNSAFLNNSLLKKIEIPLCSYIGANGIFSTKVTELYLPECLSLGTGAIGVNSSLESISLPKCQYISRFGVWSNHSLKKIVLPEVSVIEGYAFGECINLSDITLGYGSVVSFDSSTFSLCHSGLRIYVPESLCNEYMSIYGSSSVLLSGGNYVYYSDIFYCGSYINRYRITLASNSDGSITINPSQQYYNEGTYVTLIATPNEERSFVRFLYGSTPEYGSFAISSPFHLSVMNDLYISAEYEENIPYYKIYAMTDGHGTINVEPSQSSYKRGTYVVITDTPSFHYVLSWFDYGSTSAYGITAIMSSMRLSMTNDWYISAVHSYVETEYDGVVICGYTDGTSKSYYWSKSTLEDSDFKSILGGGSVKWLMNLDGCIKSIKLGNGYNFSWISLNGLEKCDDANFYNCRNLTDIYLYGNKIVDFTSAAFYTDSEAGPYFLQYAPTSLMIHVDCNKYGRYVQLYSSISHPKLLLKDKYDNSRYHYFIDHITCESVSPIISYTVNISEVEGGKTIVVPSKTFYKPYDEVEIHVLNSYNYSFKKLNWGETSAYSSITQDSYIKTTMINDLYLKPEFNSYECNIANGLLYYNYYDCNSCGEWIPWSLPYLTSSSNYGIRSCIDLGQTIVKISDNALYADNDESLTSIGSALFPVCKEIGNSAFESWRTLKSLDAKQVEVIQKKGLAECTTLSGLDFPNLVATSIDAFFNTNRITFVNMPNLKYCGGFCIGNIVFSQTLESMTLPNLLYLEQYYMTTGVFYRRTNLQYFNAPNCRVFIGGDEALVGTSISSLYLPNCCLFQCGQNVQDDYIWKQLKSLTLSDKFCLLGHSNYSSLITISDANIGRFPEGWNNTKLTNETCNVYGISSNPLDESIIKNIDYINMDNCFYANGNFLQRASMISEIILKDCQRVDGGNRFSNFSQLTKVDLRNVYSLGSYLFISAPKLTNINVDNVMILNDDTFSNCGMSVLSLPNAVWLHNGIRDCKNLKDVYLNSSIKTYFDSYCFDGCNSELMIHVPSSQYSRYVYEDGFNIVSLYNQYDLTYSSMYLRDLFTSNNVRPEIKGIYIKYDKFSSFVIPSMNTLNSTMYGCYSAWTIDDKYGLITSLSYRAFGNTILHKINFPACQTIGAEAFYSIDELKDVEIPNVKYIGNKAFYKCSNISSSLTLNTCSFIGADAFFGCSLLYSVYLLSNSVVNFDAPTTFAYCNDYHSLSIYVPRSLYNDYINKYGDISVPFSKGGRYYKSIITSI